MLSGMATVFPRFLHFFVPLSFVIASKKRLITLTGDAVICGKMNGEVQICDLRPANRKVKWNLIVKQALRSLALEEHLLTW